MVLSARFRAHPHPLPMYVCTAAAPAGHPYRPLQHRRGAAGVRAGILHDGSRGTALAATRAGPLPQGESRCGRREKEDFTGAVPILRSITLSNRDGAVSVRMDALPGNGALLAHPVPQGSECRVRATGAG